ncbi:ABC-F family ATP-binding cassette domain-containing protein [Rickettsia bellii]|uniref:Probable ATP-binding protein YbiT n=1 Tax=Rickettsia bellii (strain RML369-C) TaxID=336407 RepID=Q1RJJ6_RICBR|nr:ABC-F family ATP-binding cassette domain-containing protein [Rickettsia bellii]ABE04468.1 ABC transporter ATP-binding protein [Rickettsia bellii RML369-C]ABV79487.1 ABC transporter ATP-binding protein [Rickettsia bellii OSU 85-389]
MIIINDLAMSYGAKILFTDVNLHIKDNKRYGLVGANGAGKTTFFKVLMSEEEPAFGEVNIPKNSKVGCLKQDQFLFENTKIIDTVIAGNKELWQALQEKEEILNRQECSDEDGYKLGELEQIIFDNDGYSAEVFASSLLTGLGINEKYHYEPLSILSGGYKLRVLLAQSLFNNPDILLLDEPTNHLDIVSIYWLENYLKNSFKGILIFISHDLVFLNNVATDILDIDYGEIKSYTGNYDNFTQEKAIIAEQKLSERNFLEKKIENMQAWVDKFRAGTRARQSSSREKQLEKIQVPDLQKTSRISPLFRFLQLRPSGKLVLKIDQITKSFEDKQILNKVGFSVSRGEKIIIIGANGIGKSTLLKILMNKIEADQGSYEWGYEAQISYFAQDHHELLNENISILDWLKNYAEKETENTVRNILGQVLFRSDEVNKNILNLSGGEGARLLLAKMILEKSNILVLDEPTNHLDLESREALKKALVDFEGTVILVTHDRDFASLATRIIALSHKRNIIDFKGKYKEYVEKHGNDYLKI